MCGPHHYLGRGAFAPDSAIVCLLLQRDQNASVVGQRRADLSPGSAGRKPKNVPHPRRTPSPLLQGLGSRYTAVLGEAPACSATRLSGNLRLLPRPTISDALIRGGDLVGIGWIKVG